jgi:ribonuclease E
MNQVPPEGVGGGRAERLGASPGPVPTDEPVANGASAGSNDAPARRRRRRGGRGRRSGASASPSSVPVTMEIQAPLAEPTEERPGKRRAQARLPKERRGRPVGRFQMAVHVHGDVTHVAILEGRSLIQHVVSRSSDTETSVVGNIYLGRVVNVLPGMEAAFVDIGTAKNAVLYRGDVRYEREDLEGLGAGARIEQLLRPKQVIVCQAVKNPIAHKGARLTQEVSLPGRFVVLVPGQRSVGISKRLPDEERRRLRRLVDDLVPEGFGVILRTAAEGATGLELERDIEQLVGMWRRIDERARSEHAPALLYREPPAAVRLIREEFSREFRSVTIDDRALYEDIAAYVQAISPELADRVEYYDPQAEGVPLFQRFRVQHQLTKALERKVWLPSGGSLVIDRTEALTVIDVNTARNVGELSLEETIHRNNLEAVEEIARQLRLRDIGGIIVIDIVDMLDPQNREDVMRAFRAALARDKTRTHVYDMSPLGLIQMTRQRISEGLVESLSATCPTCHGTGYVLDEEALDLR